jgi:hypothetical protein
MSLGDNLGVASLIVGCFGIAAVYLWPDKRWIGWAALLFAGVLVAGWAFVNISGPFGAIIGGALLVASIVTLLWLLLKPKRWKVPALDATVRNAEYPPGTQVGKILWSSRFTDLRVSLWNHGGVDFEDIDLVLQPDEAIAAMDQVTHLPDVFCCSTASANDKLGVELLDGATGKRTVVPLELIASTGGYRVQCKKVPRKQRLDVVMAIVSMPDIKAATQKPAAGVFDRTYTMRIERKDGPQTWHNWYGHGQIEEVYSPNRPVPKAIQVDGTYKIKGQEQKMSQRLPVRDLIDEMMPQITNRLRLLVNDASKSNKT